MNKPFIIPNDFELTSCFPIGDKWTQLDIKPYRKGESMDDLFRKMAASWPSAIVGRTEISRFTGGVISEKSLANLDSKGLGPRGRIRIGRKIAYPVASILAWLESRSATLD